MDEEVQEQQQSEQQTEAAFLAGFNGEPVEQQPATPPAKAEPAAAEGEGEQQPAKATDEPAKAEGEGAPKEEPVIAGFTESELRNLLAGAAKVGTLEEQLRKAHGTIGELKGRFLEMSKSQAPARLTPEQKQQIEQANPDVAAYVRDHVVDLSERIPDAAPQPQQAAGATDSDLQAALMDMNYEGWKEKVATQDFALWLAAQPEETRTTYETTTKAKELGGVISKFDAWVSSRNERQTKGKARLEAAVTPTGTAGKPKTAPDENDAFLAGFKAVHQG